MTTDTIDPLALPSLPLSEKRNLPCCPAIYFVLAGERVLYIGRSANLAQRWTAHHRWRQLMQLDTEIRIAWLECSDGELLIDIEAALIRHFAPELNDKPIEGLPAKFQVYLPEDLRTRFKAKCVMSGTTMNETAVKLIEAWTDQPDQPDQPVKKEVVADDHRSPRPN